MSTLNIAIQVAREFGYSDEAIAYCLKSNPLANSGELVDKLWQLDDGGLDNVDGVYSFRIYTPKKTNSLREETLALMAKEFCFKCKIEKRNIVSLPCSCFAECQKCIGNICALCGQMILEKIQVYR